MDVEKVSRIDRSGMHMDGEKKERKKYRISLTVFLPFPLLTVQNGR